MNHTPGFTPGPWTAEEGIIVDADGCLVAQVLSTYIEGANYRDAHAHLIAAAPEMYEALKVALEDINSTIETDVLANLVASPDDHGLAATHRIIWQAIAQAEGRGDT